MDEAEQVLKQSPHNIQARADEVKAAIASALSAKQSGNNELALAYLLRAGSWIDNDAELLLDTAIEEEAMRLYHDAEATLAKAAALRPDDPRTLYAEARIKMDLNQPEASEAAWKAYLQHRPADASAHYGYGVLLHTLQRNEDAKQQFGESVKLQPNQAESYYRLGEIAREAGDVEEAKAQYRLALKHDAKHAGALTGLGILEYREAHYDAAEHNLKLAVACAPGFQTAHYYYGLTLAKLNRKEQSKKELDIAMQLTNAENERRSQSRNLGTQPYQSH